MAVRQNCEKAASAVVFLLDIVHDHWSEESSTNYFRNLESNI